MRTLLIAAFSLLIPFSAHAAAPDLSAMTQTFDDEFAGAQLDENLWWPHYRYAETINNELQAYTPDSFVFDNGILKIRADKRAFGGKDYTSGAMATLTKFSQTYGYFEIRAKMPKGKGFWPAFWLLPVNGAWPPEIDVMEHLGREPDVSHQTFHWSENGENKHDSHETRGIDFTADYHTYAVEWRADKMIFFIDGTEEFRVEGDKVPHVPMYMLVNLAVGGDWAQAPDNTTPFPSTYDIDYIRAYQFKDSSPEKPEPVRFVKVTASPQIVKAGEMVHIEVGAQIGDADLPDNGEYNIQIVDFAGKAVESSWGHSNDNKAGSVKERQFDYIVPATLPGGIYSISPWFKTGDASTHLGLSASFEVRNGTSSALPPLPPLNP